MIKLIKKYNSEKNSVDYYQPISEELQTLTFLLSKQNGYLPQLIGILFKDDFEIIELCNATSMDKILNEINDYFKSKDSCFIVDVFEVELDSLGRVNYVCDNFMTFSGANNIMVCRRNCQNNVAMYLNAKDPTTTCSFESFKKSHPEHFIAKLIDIINKNNMENSPVSKVNFDSGYYNNQKAKLSIGDIVEFGSYPHDANGNKKTIKWRILEKKGNQVLLLSEYALDCHSYNFPDSNAEQENHFFLKKIFHKKTDPSLTSVTWESCTLRKWLNSTFLNTAFSKDEQSKIQNANVSADKNPKYATNPGNVTSDKIFLLSILDAEKYFLSNEDRKCLPTAYAITQGVEPSKMYTKSGVATCNWWLRSPGDYQYFASPVDTDGGISYHGLSAYNGRDLGVRPALWINLDS